MSVGGAAMTMTRASREGAREVSPYQRAGRASSLSLPAQFAQNHGDFLLALSGPRHLGIHHDVPGEVPASGPGIRDVLPGSLDSLGYAVSCSARHPNLVSWRIVGQKSHESVRESAYACRVPRVDHRDEYIQSDVRVVCDGHLCMAVLWVQRADHGGVAASVRFESRHDRVDYR